MGRTDRPRPTQISCRSGARASARAPLCVEIAPIFRCRATIEPHVRLWAGNLMREVETRRISEGGTFAACLATILELSLDAVPEPAPAEDVAGWRVSRWLGGFGLGLVPVADAATFSWPGPWIGRVGSSAGDRRAVVMYGVPSGVVFDPGAALSQSDEELLDGFVIAACDIALGARNGARHQPPRAGSRRSSSHPAPARLRVSSSPRSCSRAKASTATGTSPAAERSPLVCLGAP